MSALDSDTPLTDKDLYGPTGQPQSSDIVQGHYGDCYLVSTLGTLAHQQPDTIKNAIHCNPDGKSFTVTLYEKVHKGFLGMETAIEPVKFVVTKDELKADRDAKGVDNPDSWKLEGGKTGDPPLWPQVLEVAYGKQHATHRNESVQDDLNHIGKGGHPAKPIFALTGLHDQTLSARSLRDPEHAYDQLTQALNRGCPVLLNTNVINSVSGDPKHPLSPDGLVLGDRKVMGIVREGHTYMVEGVEKQTDKEGHVHVMLTLRNPWGNNDYAKEGVNSKEATVQVDLTTVINNHHLDSIDIGPSKDAVQEQRQKLAQSASQAEVERVTGDPYVDRAIAAAEANDPVAFKQVMTDLSQSDFAQAAWAEAHATALAQQNQELRRQVDEQALTPPQHDPVTRGKAIG